MFDPGITSLIEGPNIDRPYNAITLRLELHRHFGNLNIYFEAEPGPRNRYTIKPSYPRMRFQPITRDLYITPDHTIEPPRPRFLALHRACCVILHMSGAGEYIDKVLRDVEPGIAVRSDGATALGAAVCMRLHETGIQTRVF
jgi:hypothetical protein